MTLVNYIEGDYVRCICGSMGRKDAMERHTCDPRYVAAHGKNVCIDCLWHNGSTLEELQAIKDGSTCKHFDPLYWEAQGYQRNWGDAAIMALPTLEILRKEDELSTKYLIIQPQLRRTVEIYIDKKTGYSWGSF
jgi:hypothetical protein